MNLIHLIAHNFLSFIVILTFIVFIHEFGHYYIARICGVKVEEFSIGFGKELFGFNDKKGTRWKFCILPFGGFVKMFGDKDPASVPDSEKIKSFTEEEKKISFYFQNVYKRIAIVVAGPLANFILTIVIFTAIFKIQGVTKILPIIDKVIEGSAAQESGIKPKDQIIKINNIGIEDFSQMQKIIIENGEKNLKIEVLRDKKNLVFDVTPKISVTKDLFGNEVKIPMIGVSASAPEFNHADSYKKLNFGAAFVKAVSTTYDISVEILKATGQLIIGNRSIKELGGPIKIAEYSGKSFDMGIMVVMWFIAMISVNLAVINLLPLPMLDGGHIFYYLIEIIQRKPLAEKTQQYGFRIGLTILLSLMMFTIYNDLSQILLKH